MAPSWATPLSEGVLLLTAEGPLLGRAGSQRDPSQPGCLQKQLSVAAHGFTASGRGLERLPTLAEARPCPETCCGRALASSVCREGMTEGGLGEQHGGRGVLGAESRILLYVTPGTLPDTEVLWRKVNLATDIQSHQRGVPNNHSKQCRQP